MGVNSTSTTKSSGKTYKGRFLRREKISLGEYKHKLPTCACLVLNLYRFHQSLPQTIYLRHNGRLVEYHEILAFVLVIRR